LRGEVAYQEFVNHQFTLLWALVIGGSPCISGFIGL